MKKNLIQITHDMQIGGLQQVVLNICKNIDRDKFNVCVLCLRTGGELVGDLEKLGIKVYIIPKSKRTNYLVFLEIIKILRAEKIDIVHTHNTQPFIDGTIAARLCGVKKIIHTDHARNFPDKKRYMLAEWFFSHFVYKIVGVSDHTTKNLELFEKISKKKLLTIPNGIDKKTYTIKVDRSKLLKDLNLPEEKIRLGLGVRFTEQKGLFYLLSAIDIVRKTHPNIVLLLVGDGPLMNSIKNQINKLSLSHNVFLLGQRMDMNAILSILDTYILSSLWEGLPMGIIEAMAAGCPIIATDVGGVNTCVKNGINGLLVKPGIPSELANAIRYLLDDKKLVKTFSINSKKIFEKHFDARIMTKKYMALYSSK